MSALTEHLDDGGDTADWRGAMDRLRESEQTALRASESMSSFLTTMSHELRTPLNGVLGIAQAMAMGELSEVQRERLKIVQSSGEALLALLNDLLDLAKIKAGKAELDDGVIDAAALADGAQVFGALLQDKDVRFSVTLAPNARGEWRGDAKRVAQVLHNLVANAVKFTDQGSVAVDIFRQDDRLVLRVEDTGAGIPKDRLEHIFERFVQADASMTRRHGGCGLGLAICSDLVGLMKGDIRVQSTEGAGTTFTVSLPLPYAEAVAAPGLAAPEPVGGLRVLAAEDNPTNQLVLKALLSAAGIEPVIMANGEEALQAWKDGVWDIVLMDIQMPVMDGVAATKAIRRIERAEGRAHTPIIAVTANAMAYHREDYLAAGMDEVVAKPVNLAALLAAMDRSLDFEDAPAERAVG